MTEVLQIWGAVGALAIPSLGWALTVERRMSRRPTLAEYKEVCDDNQSKVMGALTNMELRANEDRSYARGHRESMYTTLTDCSTNVAVLTERLANVIGRLERKDII